MMYAPPVTDCSQGPSSLPEVFLRGGRWSPEAQLLILASRTVIPEAIRHRIRAQVEQPLDWKVVLDLARYHGVGPLLLKALTEVCAEAVPKEEINALRLEGQAGKLLSRVLSDELVHLCQAFERAGVPAIPFKGASLAAMAYGNLSLRDFDDLDFIVPQDRLADAQHTLSSQGYQPRDRSGDAREAAHADEPYHVFVRKNSLVRVDLQWIMAHDQFAFRLDRPEIWHRLVSVPINGARVKGLCPEDLLIILCVHGSKHAWERLKWVADVAELLRAQRLNWKRIFAAAEEWRCRRMLLLGLLLAGDLMDAPVPPPILCRAEEEAELDVLAKQMPKSLLLERAHGIDEEDAPALYLSLRDSWWERVVYALCLLRHDHPILRRLPAWCRARRMLQAGARCAGMLRRSVSSSAGSSPV